MQPTELLSKLQGLRADLVAGNAGVFFVGSAAEGKDQMTGYLTVGTFDAKKGTLVEDFAEQLSFAGVLALPTDSFQLSIRTAKSLYAALQHTYQANEPVLVGVSPTLRSPVAAAVAKADTLLSPTTYTPFEAGKDVMAEGKLLQALDEVIASLTRTVTALTVQGSRVWKRLAEKFAADTARARREMAVILYNQSSGMSRLEVARRLAQLLELPVNAHNCALLDRDLRELEGVSLDEGWVERLAARIELESRGVDRAFRPVDVFELRR